MKYQRSTKSGCNHVRKTKFVFVIIAQLLCQDIEDKQC